MFKSLTREIVLAIQARSGVTPALFIGLALAAFALLTAFAFLCVAGYAWFAAQFGAIFGALILAGIFLLLALIAAIAAASARRRAKQRAILERAAHAQTGGWLLDPKILTLALQFGRSLGWERLVPIALLGFLAAQWARERRREGDKAED